MFVTPLMSHNAGGGGGSAFDTLMASADLWLRAEDVDDPVDGQPVTTWSAKGSTIYDAIQATSANKPLYKTGIINGKPAVLFDGSNDYLTLDGYADLPKTIVAVVQPVSIGNYKSFFGVKSNDTGPWDTCLLGSNTTSNRLEWRIAYGTTSVVSAFKSSSLANGTPIIASMTTNLDSGNINTDIWVNNVVGNSGSVSSQTPNSPDGPSIIGAGYYNNSIVDYYNIYIAELIFFSTVLSSTDLGIIETEMSTIYGISI